MKTIKCRVGWIRLVAALGAIVSAAAITRADPVFPTFDIAADPQSAVDYWTPERMRLARPPSLPGTDDGTMATLSSAHLAMEDVLEHETRILSPAEVALHPHASIGKVFFKLRDFDFFCSACAVTSEGRWGEGTQQLVLTAGHCLNDGDGGFASSFMFVPGYDDGNAPSGRWAADRLWTTNEWNSGLGLAHNRDVGFARVVGTDEYAGAKLHDVVDPLHIAFTESYPEDGLNLHVEPSTGTEYASIGYGILNWGGESQVRTLSQVDRFDLNFDPPPLGAPSTHTGGSSGGPWLVNYEPDSDGHDQNVVNGVNAYVYGGEDRMYSPQFDDVIHSLWAFVETGGLPEPLPVLLKVDVSDPSAVRITATGAFADVEIDLGPGDALDGTTLLNFFTADRGEAEEVLSEADLLVISDNEPIVVDGQETFMRDSYDSFFVDSHTGPNRDLNLYRDEEPEFEQFFLTDQPAFTGEAVVDLSGFALPPIGSIGRIMFGYSEAVGPIIGVWVVVPEPHSALLVVLGLTAVCAGRRRVRVRNSG